MIYSERIRNIREYEGIKQVEIAKYLELDPIIYGHYEREETIMPLKHLIKVCNYLNVSIDYVLGFSENKNLNFKKQFNKINAGKRLKEFRKELKYTQSKFANIFNTTQSVIAGYENGTYLISLYLLCDICKKYKVSADYLLGRIDTPKYLK